MSAPTAKQLSSRHVRTLRTFRKRVIDMAAQWEDVDQFCLNRLSELVDELEQAAVDITPDDAPIARDPYGTGGE